jgi:hypothetical protein
MRLGLGDGQHALAGGGGHAGAVAQCPRCRRQRHGRVAAIPAMLTLSGAAVTADHGTSWKRLQILVDHRLYRRRPAGLTLLETFPIMIPA